MMKELFNIERINPGMNKSFPLDLCLLADVQQNDETLQKLNQDPEKLKNISNKSIFGTKVKT